ncbi:MAG: Fe-S cluster protein [Nitrospinota bacterium]|nr:Fe-S cluster protein [Nitrospinota bacterium]
MADSILEMERALASLGDKNCGLCGQKTCADFAAMAKARPEEFSRCVFLSHSSQPQISVEAPPPDYLDILGREYDFILEKYPGDAGPRETILLFNPANVERLGIKKGDYLVGRPAAAGCPVAHCGVVISAPDYFNGMVEWLVMGPVAARERGIDIGMYTPVAYEGLAIHPRVKLAFGLRYYFLPRYCMLQVRHSGLLNTVMKTNEGLRVRLEGIMLG